MELILSDKTYNPLIPVVDFYLSAVPPITINRLGWYPLIHKYAKYCIKDKGNNIAKQKIEKIILNSTITDEGKAELERLLIVDPIDLKLTKEVTTKITKTLFSAPDITLNNDNNFSSLKQNLDEEIIAFEISKISIDSDEIKDPPLFDKIHNLVENDLITGDLLLSYCEKICKYSISKNGKNKEERLKDLLLLSGKKVPKKDILDIVIDKCQFGMLNDNNFSAASRKKILQIIELLFKDNNCLKTLETGKKTIINFVKNQISDKKIGKDAMRLGKTIFEYYDLSGDTFSLGYNLLLYEESKAKTIVNKKILSGIFNISDEDIERSFGSLFDEDLFSEHHLKSLAKKICKKEHLKISFHEYAKNSSLNTFKHMN